jgi:ADP-ribosyl-[dinitrogen reductase] hydrolase
VVETLQTVFHYLFTTATFEECLIGVVNQGGDADTTGAIAGMIAGAFYGEPALPKRWLRKLDKTVFSEIEQTSQRLLDLAPFAQQRCYCKQHPAKWLSNPHQKREHNHAK